MGDESIQVHLSPRWLNSSTSGCSKSFTFSKGLRDSHLSPPWRWEQDEALLAHPWHKIVSQEDRGVSAGRIIVRQFNEIILRDLKSDKGSFPRPRCTWEELMEMKKSALTRERTGGRVLIGCPTLKMIFLWNKFISWKSIFSSGFYLTCYKFITSVNLKTFISSKDWCSTAWDPAGKDIVQHVIWNIFDQKHDNMTT